MDIKFSILELVVVLKGDVEYFRIAEYVGEEGLAIKVCPNGFPGIVFQHSKGEPVVSNIITSSGRVVNKPPTLFLYRQVTELSVMNYKHEPYTWINHSGERSMLWVSIKTE
jgi:hypothetical protein